VNRDLAVAWTCRAVAVLELVAAIWLATHTHWWIAALTVSTAPGLFLVDALCRRAHHRARAKAQRTTQLKRGETPAPLVPCCQFWLHSDGEVHGPGCTRPSLPRRDTYRLDPGGRAAFEEITRRYDDRSTA